MGTAELVESIQQLRHTRARMALRQAAAQQSQMDAAALEARIIETLLTATAGRDSAIIVGADVWYYDPRQEGLVSRPLIAVESPTIVLGYEPDPRD